MDNICFVIDNSNLYNDKTLIWFNETPVFFICKSFESSDYFIVLCSDIENLEYIVVKQTLKNIYKMFQKQLTMRELFLNCSFFWKIKTGEDINNDVVETLDISKIDLDVLPIENAYYQIVCTEDEEYLAEIKNEYFKGIEFSNLNYHPNIVETQNFIFDIYYNELENIHKTFNKRHSIKFKDSTPKTDLINYNKPTKVLKQFVRKNLHSTKYDNLNVSIA